MQADAHITAVVAAVELFNLVELHHRLLIGLFVVLKRGLPVFVKGLRRQVRCFIGIKTKYL